MFYSLRRWIWLLDFCLMAFATQAEIITVGQDGGTSFSIIQDAIDAASDGDEIIVSTGHYIENINFLGKNIILRSTDPQDIWVREATVIDGNQTSPVITFSGGEGTTCVIAGFTITNGTALFGRNIFPAGIDGNKTLATIEYNYIQDNGNQDVGFGFGSGLVWCNGLIQHNIIRRNEIVGGNGGGLFECQGTIQFNTIDGNRAGTGGGLYNCDGLIQNNYIVGNFVDFITNGGGAMFGCDGTIQNNIFFLNISFNENVVGGVVGGTGIFRNNVMYRNGFTALSYSGKVRNCIFFENSGDQVRGTTPTFSCIQNWTGGGEGNISLDPRMVDPSREDFRLLPDSPCIDSGGTVPLTIDFAGCLRPFDGDGITSPIIGDGSEIDMGPYEFAPTDFYYQNFLLGKFQLTPEQQNVFDINQDGTVDVADIIYLITGNGKSSSLTDFKLLFTRSILFTFYLNRERDVREERREVS